MKCDQHVTWSGWYRLFINGVSAHIPETCITTYGCGTYAALGIPDGHPRIEDGVVTRDACALWNDFCCFVRSFPIKVKACPGNYYVYELVSPTVCYSAYCAGDYMYMSSFYMFMIFVSLFNHYSSKLSDVSTINPSSTAVTPATISTVYPSVDPCYNYTVLDEPWRANSSRPSNSYKLDKSVSWSGWYRLFINGVSTQIADTCVEIYSCGTAIPLWIRGGHPTVEAGVVTRDVCGHWDNYCCYYGSYSIKVKACPGNYHVYELVRPAVNDAVYCAGNYNYMSLCIIYAIVDWYLSVIIFHLLLTSVPFF
ncbi:uncharacterized protein LOC132142051 [Carassius carassius]|uniref:uncharacterized protein LOC132142051 n=1 Tax=Carassius carassius TaxID=217509 RepID=UPI002868A25F|nr:uncharacterized protein LOC132142051 [Carassius carassius]